MSVQPRKRKDLSRKQDLNQFRFNPVGLDLKWGKNLITTFDGYRIHRCYDLTFIEKAVDQLELPESFRTQWKTIRPVLHKFASIGPEVPGVLKNYSRRATLQTLSIIVLTIAVPLAVATFVFDLTFIAWLVFPLTIVAIMMACGGTMTSSWYNRKIAWAIHDYLELDPGRMRTEKIALREWVQILIDHCSRIMRGQDMDPDDHPVKFFNDDYDRILVLKDPGGLRKHYLVLLKV